MNKKQLLAAKVAEMLAMINKAKSENRAFSADEETVYAALEASKKQLEKEITDEELQARREAELQAQAATLNTPVPTFAARQDPVSSGVVVGKNREEDKPWANFGEQLMAVKNAAGPERTVDPRLFKAAASGSNESVGSEGGFLVQDDYTTELLKRVYQTGVLASKVRKVPLSANSNGMKIPAIDEKSRVNGARWGGIQAYWGNEADTVASSKPKFRTMEMNLHKLIGLAYATDELLADAAALEMVITDAFTEEFAFRVDDALMNGDGVGKPLGILKSPSLVTVAKEAGQANGTVVVQNIVNMWSRAWGRSRLNAAWYINQDIEPQLYTMSLAVGSGGIPVYMPAGGISGSPYSTLFGRPVIPVEQCNTLGGVGDIVLSDFSQYAVIDKGAVQAAQSVHVRFIYDENCFRFTYRVDGQPIWNSPLTPFKGTNTQSPFVTLAAR